MLKDDAANIIPERTSLRDNLLIETKKKHIKGFVQSIFHSNKEFYLTIGLSDGQVRRIKLQDILYVQKFYVCFFIAGIYYQQKSKNSEFEAYIASIDFVINKNKRK